MLHRGAPRLECLAHSGGVTALTRGAKLVELCPVLFTVRFHGIALRLPKLGDLGALPFGEIDVLEQQAVRSAAASRSEERRVGKECRSRGSPYHQKKKCADAGRRRASGVQRGE